MKKTFLFTALLSLFVVNGVFAEGPKKPAGDGGDAMEQGKFAIDLYYGFPNLWTAVLKNAYENSGSTQTNFSIKGFGPVGGRFEYMVSDNVGLGAEVNYSTTSVEYTDVVTSGAHPGIYDYRFAYNRLRIMGAFGLHFGQSENFDAFWAVRAGYAGRTYTQTTTDPDYSAINVKGLSPLAFRTAIGVRYFFTDNIGLNAEIGIGGGPLMTAGLSFKF